MRLDQGVDLIGDIHGCAASLRLLLERLGYREQAGVYRHPARRAIFVGDLIDRGPRIRETIEIVRSMVEAGQAEIVMGNHEYNYLCFRTESRTKPGRYLRDHTPRNTRIVQQTLDQYANHPADEQDLLSWILDIPLLLEYDSLRVVHACWHKPLIKRLRAEVSADARIDMEFVHRSTVHESFEYLVMDRLLRGTHMRLPNNEVMVSKDGFKRTFFRTKFWAQEPQKMIDVVFQPDPLPEHIAMEPLTAGNLTQLQYYAPNERALFIGHFWCEGEPKPVAPNIACLDYSAVKYGKLVAYRFDGEPLIDQSKFVWVDVDQEFPRDGANG